MRMFLITNSLLQCSSSQLYCRSNSTKTCDIFLPSLWVRVCICLWTSWHRDGWRFREGTWSMIRHIRNEEVFILRVCFFLYIDVSSIGERNSHKYIDHISILFLISTLVSVEKKQYKNFLGEVLPTTNFRFSNKIMFFLGQANPNQNTLLWPKMFDLNRETAKYFLDAIACKCVWEM